MMGVLPFVGTARLEERIIIFYGICCAVVPKLNVLLLTLA
jgi:hypothetical protein